jgi:hypothetical protein
MLGVDHRRGAVVVLVAIGTGTKQQIEQQVEGLGSNLLIVVPAGSTSARRRPSSPLDLYDVDAVTRSSATAPGRRDVAPARPSGPAPATFTSVQGVLETTPEVFVRGSPAAPTSPAPTSTPRRRVAVLGAGRGPQLFGDRDPVGQQITIAGVRFRVIGVFARSARASAWTATARSTSRSPPRTGCSRTDRDRRARDPGARPGPIDELGAAWSPNCPAGTRTPSSARSPRSRSSACSATSSAS